MSFLPLHPHSRFLLDVSRPGRYAGPEHGCAQPPPRPRVSLALAFPDTYEIGCSNLGIVILYRMASALPWVRVERAFAPWKDYASRLLQEGESLLSHETAAPLRQFDLLGFSLQHELLYTNVLLMLRLARIPLRSQDRGAGDPLVIAGGPSASNPEPLAPFIDAFALGDGEPLLPAILGVVAGGKERARPRQDVLEELSSLGGIYVPSLYERSSGGGLRIAVTGPRPGSAAPLPVRYSILRGFDETPILDAPVPALEPVFDRYQVEIARGCCGGCRFCHAGSVYRPARTRMPERILRGAVEGVLRTGHGALSLGSLSPADYPCLESLVEGLEPFITSQKILLSVSSLRSYGVSERVLRIIASVKATGITLAPEAGTARLRAVIGKQVTDEDLLGSIELLARLGWKRAKLYFMIGLPGELDEDIEGIAGTIRRCLGSGGGRRLEIGAAVSNFVPKPFTPFQWERMAGMEELSRKRSTLLAAARGLRARIDFHDVRQSIIEGILARGGSELAPVIETASGLGCAMDGWTDQFDFERWRAAFDHCGLSMERFLDAIPREHPLPWDSIEAPVSRKFLLREAGKSRLGEATPPCRASGKSSLRRSCGAGCEKDETAPEASDRAVAPSSWVLDRIKEHHRQSEGLFGELLPEGRRMSLGLKFRRCGRAIYTGHQDMIRIMSHILRRAGLPLRFSAGFTPRPILNFRCALPLGVAGLNEEVFVEVLREPSDLGAVLRLLEGHAHPGIEFLHARAVGRKEMKEAIKALPRMLWFTVIPAQHGEETLGAVAGDLGGRTEIIVHRRPAGGRSGRAAERGHERERDPVDVRGMIRSVERASGEGLPESSALAGEGGLLCFETLPQDGHMIRMEDLREILGGYGIRPLWYIRKILDDPQGPAAGRAASIVTAREA